MSDHTDNNTPASDAAGSYLSCDEDALMKRYGAELTEFEISEDQKKELLIALWSIMQGFVDLGFSVKSGDKFTENADHGMDDVLNYLNLKDTAPETVAPRSHKNEKEQP